MVDLILVLEVLTFVVIWFVAYAALQTIGKTLVECLVALIPPILGVAAAYYVYTMLA